MPSTFGPLDFAETRLRLLGSPVYMLPSEDSAIAAPSKADAAENRRLIRLSRRPVLSETVVTFSAS